MKAPRPYEEEIEKKKGRIDNRRVKHHQLRRINRKSLEIEKKKKKKNIYGYGISGNNQ